MIRILIAEDDPHILRLIARWLRHQGHEVLEARHGLAGLLLHWRKFEVQVEAFGRRWTVKRSGEDE